MLRNNFLFRHFTTNSEEQEVAIHCCWEMFPLINKWDWMPNSAHLYITHNSKERPLIGPMGWAEWSIARPNRALLETSHRKPWEDRGSKISRTCLKHVLDNHATNRGPTRSGYRETRPSDIWKFMFRKIQRPKFRIAWLPTFRKWRPTIREQVPALSEENQLHPLV